MIFLLSLVVEFVISSLIESTIFLVSSDIDISSIVFSTVCSKSFKISLVSSIVFFRDFFKSSVDFHYWIHCI
jgi:hypothetical protein